MSVLNLVFVAVICVFKQIFLGFTFGLFFLVCMKNWFLWHVEIQDVLIPGLKSKHCNDGYFITLL